MSLAAVGAQYDVMHYKRDYPKNYQRWYRMFQHCYGKQAFTGMDVVHRRWFKLSNFLVWLDDQEQNDDDHSLNKIIFNPNNIVFSPKNCVLIPNKIHNCFKVNRGVRANKNDLPIGIIKDRNYEYYRARVGTAQHMKTSRSFKTLEEAYAEWKVMKAAQIRGMYDLLDGHQHRKKIILSLEKHIDLIKNMQ